MYTEVSDIREPEIVLLCDVFGGSLTGHVLVEVQSTNEGLQLFPVLSRGYFFEFESSWNTWL